jgi:hypothetical protein
MPRTARVDAVEHFHSQTILENKTKSEQAGARNHYYCQGTNTRQDAIITPKLTDKEIKAIRLKAELDFARSQKFDVLTVDYSQRGAKCFAQIRCNACNCITQYCRCNR